MQITARHREYWRKNLQVSTILLLAWALITIIPIYYAKQLDFNFFGWPFSFWACAQGSLIAYVAIVWIYARFMDKLDLEYGLHEADD